MKTDRERAEEALTLLVVEADMDVYSHEKAVLQLQAILAAERERCARMRVNEGPIFDMIEPMSRNFQSAHRIGLRRGIAAYRQRIREGL